MQTQGFQLEDNSGNGDCIFFALALLVWGSHDYHAMMRFWIVKWLWRHTKVYNTYSSLEKYDRHIELMAKEGTAGTHIELQAASDIFFAVVKIFSVDDF